MFVHFPLSPKEVLGLSAPSTVESVEIVTAKMNLSWASSCHDSSDSEGGAHPSSEFHESRKEQCAHLLIEPDQFVAPAHCKVGHVMPFFLEGICTGLTP